MTWNKQEINGQISCTHQTIQRIAIRVMTKIDSQRYMCLYMHACIDLLTAEMHATSYKERPRYTHARTIDSGGAAAVRPLSCADGAAARVCGQLNVHDEGVAPLRCWRMTGRGQASASCEKVDTESPKRRMNSR